MTKEEIKAIYDSLKQKTKTPVVTYRAFGRDLICESVLGWIYARGNAWYYPKQIEGLDGFEEIEVDIELKISELYCETEFYFVFHSDGFTRLKRVTCTKIVNGTDFREEVLYSLLQSFVCAIKALR